ncbi:response regulator transcription factor [Schleiferilactobacillus perolens]|uniref:Response regulator receiver transcriptional regulatory protein-like n=1 Tax=Schleiferilactobacillus perolens DSM 12744 TaxID=1423792 RepID=A0A0R1MVW8_9LACO|nr:response regulator transcription factor [Schleiferilactobacillus perolens]KRL12414.1 Response regulator receiver transcriptional regulatory protein-like [Schleiferilactobacillus perolens DSM 12744]
MERLLLIDDNPDIGAMLDTVLGDTYAITKAYSGTEGLLQVQQQAFDLILLDRMLPGKNGEEVLHDLRQTLTTPIIMLTAISDKDDVARLLMAGATDYITKPFNIKELKARIVVALRQNTAPAAEAPTVVSFGPFTLAEKDYTLHCQDKSVALKKKEFDILKLLFQHPGQVFSKEALYTQVWHEPYYGDENTINVHLTNLRKKIRQLDPDHEHIATVWGIGVKLV